MTIAEKIQSYYEHDDFIDNYAYLLLEDGSYCINRIKEELSRWFYFNDKTSNPNVKIDENDAEYILEHMRDNYSDFIDAFSNYYVGSYCIDSISFGEQEEQLTGIYNHKTGKKYNLSYLKKAFDDAGYYVDGDYAYYDLSGEGVGLWLHPKKLPNYKQLLSKYGDN